MRKRHKGYHLRKHIRRKPKKHGKYVAGRKTVPFLKGRVHEKIPVPPKGFIPLHRKRGDDTCPYCGSKGYSGGGTVFTDPKIQAIYANSDGTYTGFSQMVKGTDDKKKVNLNCHWSRMGSMTCGNCKGIIWHDWDTGSVPGGGSKYLRWNEYWDPSFKLKMGGKQA